MTGVSLIFYVFVMTCLCCDKSFAVITSRCHHRSLSDVSWQVFRCHIMFLSWQVLLSWNICLCMYHFLSLFLLSFLSYWLQLYSWALPLTGLYTCLKYVIFDRSGHLISSLWHDRYFCACLMSYDVCVLTGLCDCKSFSVLVCCQMCVLPGPANEENEMDTLLILGQVGLALDLHVI